MFCPKCGTKNEDDALFCLSCGTSLVETVVPEATSTAQDPASVEIQTNMDQANANQAYTDPTLQIVVEKKPRKPLSKKMIGIISVCAILIVAVIVFVVVGKRSADYNTVATKYFVAVQACDWDKVYSSIDIPENEFLTKDMLLKAQSKTEAQKVSNYSVSKDTEAYSKYLDEDDSDSVTRDVYISYRIKGESSNDIATVEIIKMKDKSMLFFDQYKVSPADIVATNYEIEVTKNAKVSLDGIELSDSYLTDSSSTTKKTYIIDYLFMGNHTVKITQENMEDQNEEVNVTYNDYSSSYTSPKLSAAVKTQLEATGKEAIEKFYSATVARKEFTDLSSLFVNDTKIQASGKSTYNSFRDYQTTSAGNGLTKIAWTTVTQTATQTSDSDSKTAIKVVVKGTYSATVKSSYSTTTTDKNGTVTCYFYYRYQDGAWGLYDMDLDTIY